MNRRYENGCPRCLGGKLLRLGEDLACINCGWQAPDLPAVSAGLRPEPRLPAGGR